MKFNVNQQDLQQALNYCQGVIEKRNTLPILSNILLNANNSKLTRTATDLDLIFISCTSLRAAELIPELETLLGVHVTSSNHALAWHMLRLSGVLDPLPSKGNLFLL